MESVILEKDEAFEEFLSIDYQVPQDPPEFCRNETSINLNCLVHREIKQYNCEYCRNKRGIED